MNEVTIERVSSPYGDKTRCPMCGQVRVVISKKHNLCQTCYREILKRYCYFDYNQKARRPLRGNSREVCRLCVEEHLPTDEIARITKLNVVYVRRIIKENCIRCDTFGNPYPYELLGRGE